MFGSYYEDTDIQPIGGLGLGQSDGSAEAARRLARSSPASVRYTVWANQTGETQFQDTSDGQDFLISPVQITELARAQAEAGGHPVALVGVLMNRPVPLKAGEDLFKGTPYMALKSQVLYRQDDSKPVPTPVFVVWGILRPHDNPNASYQTLAGNAAKLQGLVVTGYGAARVASPRPRPGTTAEAAIIALVPQYKTPAPLYVYSPESRKAADIAKVAAFRKSTKGLGADDEAPASDLKVALLGIGLGVVGFVIFKRVWEGIPA